jgi:hypothetical protein
MNLLDLVTNIPHLLEPSKKDSFMRIFGEYLNKYAQQRKVNQANNCLIRPIEKIMLQYTIMWYHSFLPVYIMDLKI